jgi:prepilin-type processing-associated H-X9-DG protein
MCVPAKEFMITHPAGTVMLTDSAFLDQDGNLIEYSFCEAPYYEFYGWSLADPSTHFRHAGRANVAWCDGHTTSETMNATHASGWWLSKQDFERNRLGFLGEDNSRYDRR